MATCSNKAVMTKNDISPNQHIPDLCVSFPISVHATVTLMKGMQDWDWKVSKVCKLI